MKYMLSPHTLHSASFPTCRDCPPRHRLKRDVCGSLSFTVPGPRKHTPNAFQQSVRLRAFICLGEHRNRSFLRYIEMAAWPGWIPTSRLDLISRRPATSIRAILKLHEKGKYISPTPLRLRDSLELQVARLALRAWARTDHSLPGVRARDPQL